MSSAWSNRQVFLGIDTQKVPGQSQCKEIQKYNVKKHAYGRRSSSNSQHQGWAYYKTLPLMLATLLQLHGHKATTKIT
jgi:hypothetical protein